MKIGVIGIGVVGTAIKQGFEDLGHTVKIHDIKLDTSIKDVLDTEIVYLCLPTNSSDDGSCNTEALIWTVDALSDHNYKGIIAIKSTIIPGTFDKLKIMFDSQRLCHVPEFLREKHAYDDFTKNHNVLIIGTPNDKCSEAVIKSHGNYPKKVYKMKPEEAEFVKYFSNVFKAVKITFANSFGKICDKYNVDYSKVLLAFALENVAETSYLRYNKEFKGFGGMCLPKDVRALSKLVEKENINVDLFKFILQENEKFI